MKVFVRDSAYADLEQIHAWIAADKPHAARSVIQRIGASIERLGQFPHLGHAGTVAGTLEWIVPHLPYIIVYVLDDAIDELRVIAVFHAARDRARDL